MSRCKSVQVSLNRDLDTGVPLRPVVISVQMSLVRDLDTWVPPRPGPGVKSVQVSLNRDLDTGVHPPSRCKKCPGVPSERVSD